MIVFVDPEVGHLVIDLFREHDCLVCGMKTARTYYRTHEDWRHVCLDCAADQMGFHRDAEGALVRFDGRPVPTTIIQDEKQLVEPRPLAKVYTGASATLSIDGIPIGRTSFFNVPTT